MAKRKAATKRKVNIRKSRLKDDKAVTEGKFEEAFGHIDPGVAASAAAGNRDELLNESDDHDADIGFNFSRGEVDVIMDEEELDVAEMQEDENDNTVSNDLSDCVGFGNADYFDVKDILELSDKVGPTSLDIIQELKDNCISKGSKSTYTSSIVLFLSYIYRHDTSLLHKSWIKTIKTLSFGIQDEKEKQKDEKKTLRKLLMKCDKGCPPFDFGSYSAQHFLKYLLALENKDGKRFCLSSYNSRLQLKNKKVKEGFKLGRARCLLLYMSA